LKIPTEINIDEEESLHHLKNRHRKNLDKNNKKIREISVLPTISDNQATTPRITDILAKKEHAFFVIYCFIKFNFFHSSLIKKRLFSELTSNVCWVLARIKIC